MEDQPTRIMLAVNQSTINGYPHASISCRRAFEWTLQKIVRSNTSGFHLLFLHVQVPDEDGSFSVSFRFLYSLILFFMPSFPNADRLCEMRCYSVGCFLFCGILSFVGWTSTFHLIIFWLIGSREGKCFFLRRCYFCYRPVVSADLKIL